MERAREEVQEMKVDTMGLDVTINKTTPFDVEFILSNEDEQTKLNFKTDRMGIEHTAEQFISALANYDEELLIKTLSDYANLEVK